MTQFFTTAVGRLRLLAFFEGISLLLLIFIAVPMKYVWHSPALVQAIGPIHGALFLLFIFESIRLSAEQKWSFKQTTWKVVLSSFIPFGTFYIDHRILRPLASRSNK